MRNTRRHHSYYHIWSSLRLGENSGSGGQLQKTWRPIPTPPNTSNSFFAAVCCSKGSNVLVWESQCMMSRSIVRSPSLSRYLFFLSTESLGDGRLFLSRNFRLGDSLWEIRFRPEGLGSADPFPDGTRDLR